MIKRCGLIYEVTPMGMRLVLVLIYSVEGIRSNIIVRFSEREYPTPIRQD